MSKQDRHGARTPADLERKYGKRFSDTKRYTADAYKSAAKATTAAEDAAGAVDRLDQSLDQAEILGRLTNHGEATAIFLKNGQLYINASYISDGVLNADLVKSGVLESADGTIKVDLNQNQVTVETSAGDGFTDCKGRIVLSATGIRGYGYNHETGEYQESLSIFPGHDSGTQSVATELISGNVGFSIKPGDGNTLTIGDLLSYTAISGAAVTILDREVWWEDDGYGSFTLKGR